ncbi:MAG: cytochrome c oxidase assembly protein [Chloroflexi bacterium]|nr:cytochrome c oxidase assembly protein [Chloroflexota bacterium]MCI0580681.1 cytochrome c oxidase assembly protein [Chloroflexota bacterium]MCI0648588.1 cytochrome c oxidase assembly protein [Chloroflexota bacterium]MCI0727351.1 cytochrome c oxidase assembly protein [Chloroflexota bacterium]
MPLLEDPTLFAVLRSWSWEPVILLGLGLAAAGYIYAFHHFRSHGWLPRLAQRGLVQRRHPWFFAAGLLALFLALLSPIDVLAGLLFWVHMVQHILLIMVAPPLILLGLPPPLIRWLILETKLRGVLNWLTSPLVAFALYNTNLLAWHLPALYQAALANELIHALEHAFFFYTALFYWWRLFDPTHGWFPIWPWPPAKWLYLMVAAPPSYILGSILWGYNRVVYPYYELVPRLWGVTALADQHYAGLLMWAHGWMFFMASMIAFFAWYRPEVEQVG